MPLFDSHCHLQLIKPSRRELIIEQMVQRQLGAVCVGTSVDDWQSAIEIAKQHPANIFLALGLHCQEAGNPQSLEQKVALLEGQLKQLSSDFVRAIGETGLDYLYAQDSTIRAAQQSLFLAQLELAKKYHKPVIIHCRQAYQEVYQLLQQQKPESFVMHFFVGSIEQAKKFLELGGYLSFSSVITLTDDYNQLVKFAPRERVLIETDSPFIRNNTPLEVSRVAEKVAQLKKISYAEVIQFTEENAKRFFQLN